MTSKIKSQEVISVKPRIVANGGGQGTLKRAGIVEAWQAGELRGASNVLLLDLSGGYMSVCFVFKL